MCYSSDDTSITDFWVTLHQDVEFRFRFCFMNQRQEEGWGEGDRWLGREKGREEREIMTEIMRKRCYERL